MQALIFDCDGVLADTERDGHRVAFNRAFAARRLDIAWSVEQYGALLAVAGGKERLRHYFDETGWPVPQAEQESFLLDLHRLKTDTLLDLIAGGAVPLRPGIARLVDEALAAGVTLAVCSTANERAVKAILDRLGPEKAAMFSIFAGDVVARKKPDPAIYALACKTLALDPAQCLVIEDSRIGMKAALSAGLTCVITMSTYTGDEDFSGAARVLPDLGDGNAVRLTLADCEALLR